MKASRRSSPDCLTGDLRAAVLGKTSGGFTATYAYPGATTHERFQPRSLEEPEVPDGHGLGRFRRSGRQSTFGAAVVYVVELSSGMIRDYAIP